MTGLARLVLIAGMLTAAALFFAGASSTASEDGYQASQAWCLMWAGVAAVGITLAACWLVSAASARRGVGQRCGRPGWCWCARWRCSASARPPCTSLPPRPSSAEPRCSSQASPPLR